MPLIAIDPGHPSYPGNTGCQSADGRLVECDYNIGIARMLKREVEQQEGLSAVLLRTRNDEVVTVKSKPDSRRQRAIDAEADFVLSIHVDSWHAPTRRGATILYWPGNDVGRQVAGQIASSWPPLLRRTDKGVPADMVRYKRAHYIVGAYAQTAVLCECGFASTPHDLNALCEPTVKDQIVGAMMQGLLLFRQLCEASWLSQMG